MMNALHLAQPNIPLANDLSKLLRPDQVSVKDPDRFSYGRDANSKAILWVRNQEVRYPPEVCKTPFGLPVEPEV